jgi:hypothetical protein
MPQTRLEIIAYSLALLGCGMLVMIAVTYLLMPAESSAEPRVITQRDIDDTIGNFIRDARSDFERGGQ